MSKKMSSSCPNTLLSMNGTLYPDFLESANRRHSSSKLKSSGDPEDSIANDSQNSGVPLTESSAERSNSEIQRLLDSDAKISYNESAAKRPANPLAKFNLNHSSTLTISSLSLSSYSQDIEKLQTKLTHIIEMIESAGKSPSPVEFEVQDEAIFLKYFNKFVRSYLPVEFQCDQKPLFDIMPSIVRFANSDLLKKECGNLKINFQDTYHAPVKKCAFKVLANLLRKVSNHCIKLSTTMKAEQRRIDKIDFDHFVGKYQERNKDLLCNDLMKNNNAMKLAKKISKDSSELKLEEIKMLTYFAWIEKSLDKDCKDLDDLKKRIINVQQYDFVLNCVMLHDNTFSEDYFLSVQNLLMTCQLLIAKNLLKFYSKQEKSSEKINANAMNCAVEKLKLIS